MQDNRVFKRHGGKSQMKQLNWIKVIFLKAM